MTSFFRGGTIMAAVLACLVVGCGHKQEKPSAKVTNPSGVAPGPGAENQGAPVVQASPVSANPNPTPPVGPPPLPQAPVQPVVVQADANSGAVLDQLTQALRKYSMEKRRVPATMGEVLSAGYVSGLPQPPPGKQYAIDKKQVSVVLVSK